MYVSFTALSELVNKLITFQNFAADVSNAGEAKK